MNTPPPGIYPDVPAAVYHSWDAVSQSKLRIIYEKSPLHLKHQMAEGFTPTDAMIVGSATHKLVLEPDGFADEYAVAPECDRRTKAGKAEWADFVDASEGRTVLKATDAATAIEMARAVASDRMASAMLSGDTTEVSFVWIDEETGLVCKGRADKTTSAAGRTIMPDLKTTRDASRKAFERAIFTYGMHRQAAFYVDGMKANGVDIDDFCIVAVESAPPYAVACYRLTDDTIDAGRAEMRPLLATYAECLKTGHWPGYSEHLNDIMLPAWGWGQLQTEETA